MTRPSARAARLDKIMRERREAERLERIRLEALSGSYPNLDAALEALRAEAAGVSKPIDWHDGDSPPRR